MKLTQSTLYITVTNHGFGHAVRAASVANEIQKLNPEILLVLVTTAPHWLLQSYIEGPFIHRPRAFDVGVIQSDSITMDQGATLAKLEHIQSREKAIIAGEVNFIRTNRVGLILADIPPLAASIAQAAGIPCWMMGNFGWDFIYQDWGEEFKNIVHWIKNCYQNCARLFRLPLSEPMEVFPNVTDVGLTGGTPRYCEAEICSKFGLTAPSEKRILLTFGGLGLQAIPYHNLSNFPDWQFITFDSFAPDLPNLIKVQDHHYRPVDFIPFCAKVVSKPGFSTFSEALKFDTPLVSLTREYFAEAPYLLAGIKNYSDHQIITPEEFFQGNWDFLPQKPNPPQKGNFLAKDGTETIARAVVDYFQSIASTA